MRILQYSGILCWLFCLTFFSGAQAIPPSVPESQGLYYKIVWNGFHVASLVFGWERAGNGEIVSRVAIRTYGVAKAATRFKSDTLSLTALGDNIFNIHRFKTNFSSRKGAREIILEWDPQGHIVSEYNMPPEKREKRPAVPDEMKTNALDPLTLFWVARQKIMQGEKNFTLPMYDGRRRSQIAFFVMGMKDSNIDVALKETYIAGFTKREQEDRKNRDITLHFYIDPTTYMPVGGAGKSLIGSAKGERAKVCRTFQDCLTKAEIE